MDVRTPLLTVNVSVRIPASGMDVNGLETGWLEAARRGMAWTARGAHHLAKLVIAWQNKNTWNSPWKEPSPP